MARPRHPHKAVEAAVRDAEQRGWRWRKGGGHCWGRLLCAFADRDGCRVSVWSTPRDGDVHAAQIRRVIGACPHEAPPDDP